MMRLTTIFLGALAAPPCGTSRAGEYGTDSSDFEWASPSRNVFGNLRVGAGDIACKVWIEKTIGAGAILRSTRSRK